MSDTSLASLHRVQAILTGYHEKKEHSHYLAAYRDAEASYWLPILKELDQLLVKDSNLRVLDVGTAYGTLLLYSVLGGAEGYGVDMTDAYWSQELEQDYAISWARCNIEAEELPFGDPFDIIIYTEILEHMNYNPIPVFEKFQRALKPGGSLLISTPWARAFGAVQNKGNDVTELPYYKPGDPFVDAEMKYYNIDEIFALAFMTGFAVEWVQVYNQHIILRLTKK